MIIVLAIELLVLIVLSALIWKLIIDQKDNSTPESVPVNVCEFCGFESVTINDFCPVCRNDKNGNTKENLSQKYRRK